MNTMEKAVAVLLAFGLWFVFGYQKESVQRDYVVPIEFRNVSRSGRSRKAATGR